MVKNWNYPDTFGGSLLYQILIVSPKPFRGYMEKSIYVPTQTRIYYGSKWLQIRIPPDLKMWRSSTILERWYKI
jgi:hypothetical protein